MDTGKGINSLARVLKKTMLDTTFKPPVLDFGSIQDDYSLLCNKFPLPIPQTDYVICRSVSYNPALPLTMSWWYEEGWSEAETPWTEKDKQPQNWVKERWGELINPDTKKPYWDEKHKKPPIIGADHAHGSKGQHLHEEDEDGKHYHNVYLPRKMYCLQPGDRVLVAWIGDGADATAVVIDIILPATEMM